MEPSVHLLYLPAAQCASLLRSHGDQRDIPDDDPGFLESPGVTVSSARVMVVDHQRNLPRPNAHLPPPSAALCGCEGVLPVGAGPGRREGEAGAQEDAAFGKAADSGKPSCAGELLVFCLRHDAPPEPQTRGRCGGPTRTGAFMFDKPLSTGCYCCYCC